jgi:hypothetical protein
MTRFLRTSLVGIAAMILFPWIAHAGPFPTYNQFISFDVPGAATTGGWKLNDSDTIAGSIKTSGGATQGFVRFSNGSFNQPIVAPNDNGGFTLSFGINNAGTVVGEFLNIHGNINTFHGFFLNGSTFTQYDVPVSNVSTAVTGLNNRGDFTGAYGSSVQPNQGFIQLHNGSFSTINVAGSAMTFAYGINDHDQVVGTYTDSGGVFHAFSRDASGNITTFDVPFAGATLTVAEDINNQGVIVGHWFDAHGIDHGFIDVNGQFTSFDFPGAAQTRLRGINNGNALTGYYIDANGNQHGFLAIPTPEPASLTLFGLGMAGLAGRALWRRKRLP